MENDVKNPQGVNDQYESLGKNNEGDWQLAEANETDTREILSAQHDEDARMNSRNSDDTDDEDTDDDEATMTEWGDVDPQPPGNEPTAPGSAV